MLLRLCPDFRIEGALLARLNVMARLSQEGDQLR